MKRTIASIIAVFVFAGLLVVSNVHAGENCTNASLQGTYGWYGTATNVDNGRISADVAIQTFDGAGQFTGHDTLNSNGEIFHRTFTGSYTVNPDCTGTLVFTFAMGAEARAEFVIVAGGSEMFAIQTDPPRFVDALVFKKQ